MDKFYQGNYASIKSEITVKNIACASGAIPKELHGTLYRNGPNPQFPSEHTHWFEGDGMLHQFHFHDGKMDYQNRWVMTERLQKERSVGKAIFGQFGFEDQDPYHIANIPHGTANTNIIQHGNRLLALQELSPAIAVDPLNLTTLGVWDYQGKIPQASAHPHVDPRTGELHQFAYHDHSAEILYYVINKAGTVTKTEKFTGPYACFMHDFVLTDQYAVFLFHPLTIDSVRVKHGKPPIIWEPELGTHVAILPRNGTAQDIQWFHLEAFHAYHYMNGYTEQDTLVITGMKTRRANFFQDKHGKVPNILFNTPRLTRWCFDLKRNTIREETLSSRPAEFPRIDERQLGHPYRHGFAVANVRKLFTQEFNAIIHFDQHRQTETVCFFGTRNTPSEPVFVPRSNSSAEGDGFLLTVVYQANKNTSALYILDALNLDKTPLAIIPLPQRVPNGFHGNWCPAAV